MAIIRIMNKPTTKGNKMTDQLFATQQETSIEAQTGWNAAEQLIERAERESGQRVDSNDGDNNAMAILLGAMADAMGEAPKDTTERDHFIIGKHIQLQNTPEYKRKQESMEMAANMFCAGIDPTTLFS